jgi:hypothetical protein
MLVSLFKWPQTKALVKEFFLAPAVSVNKPSLIELSQPGYCVLLPVQFGPWAMVTMVMIDSLSPSNHYNC